MPGVPGKGGRTPKRSEERLGHPMKSKEAIAAELDQVEMPDEVEIPPADPGWHKIAKMWYESLLVSGQARFFEPSDWASAHYLAQVITRNLNAAKFSGQLFAAAWQAMNDLLTTEAARRRLKLEIQRPGAGAAAEAEAAAAVMADYKSALAAA